VVNRRIEAFLNNHMLKAYYDELDLGDEICVPTRRHRSVHRILSGHATGIDIDPGDTELER
jgi:hypothetical protein